MKRGWISDFFPALLALAFGAPANAAPSDSVIIGKQRWTSSNLAVTRFRNGDAIPEIRDAAAWAAAGRAGRPAWARYGNAASAPDGWGVLYNFAAITDPRGLCPAGFRLPGKQDWRVLESALGGGKAAAASLKAATGWPAGGAGNNSSGFAALPAGFRTQRGEYFLGKRVAYFWVAERETNGTSIAHMLFDDDRPLFRIEYDVAMGMSVRCVAPA
jgi:uncharacterized protein (TIGR02145 family)